MEGKEELYMRRALDLAGYGRGMVSPNPMVGCVIVKNDKIIGEGWHQQYGQHHAEVNAISSVEDKALLTGADLYVNLEPCAHYGKTPPCSQLIIQYPFRKIYVCNKDSFTLVNGKGIQIIAEKGISIETGLLENEGRSLNRRFFTSVENKRPYIILKWAETADGFIARKDYSSKWISNEYSRKLVHKWRTEEDAVMVGTSTVKHDDPALTVRSWKGRNPIRIVVDCELKLEKNLKVFNAESRTYVLNFLKEGKEENIEYFKIESNSVLRMVEVLHENKIQSIIVEGGLKLLQSFIDCHLWDEARIFISEVSFFEGIRAPIISGHLKEKEWLGKDELRIVTRVQ